MRVLFVHQAFPGQFRHLASHLVSLEAFEVVAIADARAIIRRDASPYRITVHAYEHSGPPSNLGSLLDRIARARAVENITNALKRQGYSPDIIIAHPGWGEAMFLKDVFPDTPTLIYCEWWPANDQAVVPGMIGSLDAMDRGMSPTHWQKNQFPQKFQDRIDVIHDGIDTDVVRPSGDIEPTLVTYVARNLEPCRGFHSFMRAIPEIQRRCRNARIVIVGGDGVSYSPRLPPGQTYRQRMLEELSDRIDLSRVDFLGRIPYRDYLALLRRSAVHVHLTHPFVLSWSLIESMSAGCLIVGSRTPPVEEAIRDGENGLLVDLFSPDAIAERVAFALEHQAELQRLRDCARQDAVTRYDLKRVCLPGQLALIDQLVHGTIPAWTR